MTIREERGIKDNRDTTSLGPTTWLEYLTITSIDYSKNKGSNPYLLKQVVSIIDSEETEILKGNKIIVALSYSIGAEVGSRVERAFMPNTSRAKERANVLRKRLNRIFLNSLLKKAKNNIILRGRKQKTGHFYKKYIPLELRNI
jgi:hypothetical protein